MNEFTHPFLVHIPLGLIWILPILVILDIPQKTEVSRLWLAVMATALLIALFSYLAVYTGEIGEHILEGKIDEAALDEHEDAGEFFAILSYILFAVTMITFFLKEKLKQIGKYITLVLSCLLILAGVHAGSHGGDLVYKYGAAELLQKNIKTNENKAEKIDNEPDLEDED